MGVSAATYDALGDVEFVAHWRRGGVDSDDFGHVSPKKSHTKRSILPVSFHPIRNLLSPALCLAFGIGGKGRQPFYLYIYIYVCIYVHIEGRGRNQPP